jgi:hypothetical protein
MSSDAQGLDLGECVAKGRRESVGWCIAFRVAERLTKDGDNVGVQIARDAPSLCQDVAPCPATAWGNLVHQGA